MAATIALAIVAADQLSKLVVRHEAAHLPWRVLPSVTIELARNTGIAFSRLSGAGVALIVAIACVAVGVAIAIWKTPPRFTLPLALILGGAVGNLMDRVRWRSVVDFISVGPWPTFNLADMAIAAGAVWVALLVIFPGGGHPTGAPAE